MEENVTSIDRKIEEKIGEALILRGSMHREEVDAVLKLQKAGDRRLFGEISIDLGFLDVRELIDYLRAY
jgi:hypothetical protein